MIIGICGGSGSGKTTLMYRLAHQFAVCKPTLFSMDNYYFPIEKQVKDAKGVANFDLPSSIDRHKLYLDLLQLQQGSTIQQKEYNFNSETGKNVLITLNPSQLIFIEGLFLFEYQEIHQLLDFSIFIDFDSKLQLDRRLYRDQEIRGYDREDILYRWEHHVLPCFENFLLPYRNEADFIYNNTTPDEEFLRLVKALEFKLTCSKK